MKTASLAFAAVMVAIALNFTHTIGADAGQEKCRYGTEWNADRQKCE